jgi:transposase-like protein
MKNKSITFEYAEKMRPLIPLAHKAYGSKSQNTPAHQASKEYTRLVTEFVENKGSLIDLSKELGVSYSGLRRRAFTASVPTLDNKRSRIRLAPEAIDAAVERVKNARNAGTEKYHEQLFVEYYENGVSLSAIAKGLGISNAGPLYYGVQRHARRDAHV